MDQTFYNSYGTLLTTMHQQCLDFLWLKILLSFQHSLPNKQQTIVNCEAKNTMKIVKEFWQYLRRHNHLSSWNYFQLDLFPTVHQMVWDASTQLVSHYSQSQHGSSFFSKQITIFSIQLFNAQPHHRQLACPSYFSNTALMDDSNLQSLHVVTNSLPTPTRGRLPQGVAGGVKNHPLLSLSPQPLPPHINGDSTPLHSYTCFTLSIYPYHCPLPMTSLTFVQ